MIEALIPAAAVVLLSSCVANPGPPPVVDEQEAAQLEAQETASVTETTTPVDSVNRTQVAIGVDPLEGGLNPHLVLNNSELVEQLADLVLPSTFRNGQMDTDLLDKAGEVIAPLGTAQRVEYRLSSAAQWSDGTPISSADFIYLWQAMVTTPGVKSPAGYRAIRDISTADGGRTVVVDFSQRVAQWDLLFNDLLPSHLLGEETFDAALADDIPASAGRFKVVSVDRARGMITLNRNDRYWGSEPARVDILRLREVRSSQQGVNMLRSGQIGFADITPEQTTFEALALLPGVATEEVQRSRQLRLHLALADAAARRQLAGLIDTAQIARLATGRTDGLQVPYGGTPQPTDQTDALVRLGRPVVIAADPTDDVAARAATVIVDQLRARGVEASVLSEKLAVITGDKLPSGAVDAVITWEDTAMTSLNLANSFLCVGEATAVPSSAVPSTSAPVPTSEVAASASEVAAPWAGNLSGYCPQDAAQTRAAILSGRMTVTEALGKVRELNAREHLYVPILDETRLHALGTGIVGPGENVEDWREGLISAPKWEQE